MPSKRDNYSSTGKNLDQISISKHLGHRKHTITQEQLEKEKLTDELLMKLQYENNLSNESIEKIRKSIDKTLEYYKFEKNDSNKSIYEQNLDILEEFLQSKRIENKSPVTLYNYGNEISRMFMNMADKLYSDITTDDIREYIDYRKVHDGLAPTSLQNIRMFLRSFFSWLKVEEKIKKNPMDRIAPIKTDKKVVDTLTDEEVEMIRCACKSERDLAIVDMLASSGMRVSELCRLNIEDINIEEGTAKVYGKGSKERVCFLNGRAKIHLKWYLAERVDNNPALFVTAKKPYTRISKNGIEYILKEIAKKTGIPKLRLYPHKFRKTLATNLINRGATAEKIQHILGHQQIGTVQIYANISDDNLKQTYKQYVT